MKLFRAVVGTFATVVTIPIALAVAGCLIAFGCREALKLKNAYKGYLTFVSKTSLIEWYSTKYYATQTLGTRMYIDPISGEKLISKYLKE